MVLKDLEEFLFQNEKLMSAAEFGWAELGKNVSNCVSAFTGVAPSSLSHPPPSRHQAQTPAPQMNRSFL